MSNGPERNQPIRPDHERMDNAHADHELPSLEGKARVPYHQADDQAPMLARIEQVTDKKKGFWTAKRAIGAGVAAVVFAGAGVFGAESLGGNSHNNDAKSPRPTASAPATPGSTTETTQDPANGLPSIEASPLYKALTTEQQATIEKYKAMDLTTFQALPSNEQFIYAQFLMDAYEPYAVAELQNHQVSNDGSLQSFPSNMLSAYQNETVGDSGQTIVNGISVRQSIPMWSMTNYGSDDVLPNRVLDAEKMLSAVYAPTDKPEAPNTGRYGQGYSHFINFIESTQSLGKPGVLGAPNDGYFVSAVVAESPTQQSALDPTVYLKTVNESIASQPIFQQRLMYSQLPDITGKVRGTWRILYTFDSGDPRAEKLPGAN